MAVLKDIRASIISSLTGGDPTIDFSIPDALIDYRILTTAASLRNNQRSRTLLGIGGSEGSTMFECMPVKAENPECFAGVLYKRYYIDLPFLPIEMPDDSGIISVIIQDSGQSVRHISYSGLPLAASLPECSRPSADRPYSARLKNKLYLFAGQRDLTHAKVMVQALVGTPASENTDIYGNELSCQVIGDVMVPVQDSIVPDIEIRVIQSFLNIPIEEDITEDGI